MIKKNILKIIFLSILISLSLVVRQKSIQYTDALNLVISSASDFVYFENYSLKTNDTYFGHITTNLPISEKDIVELKSFEEILTVENVYLFSLFSEQNLGKKASVTIKDEDNNKINDYTFSYGEIYESILPFYLEDNIEKITDIFIDGKQGIIISYDTALKLGIEELANDIYLNFKAFIPIAYKEITFEGYSTTTGTYLGMEPRYVEHEFNIPVIGILKKTHSSITPCFGYIDYQTMEMILDDSKKNLELYNDEKEWRPNTLALLIEPGSFETLKEKIQKFNYNATITSTEENATTSLQLMLSTEKPQRILYYLLLGIFFLLSYRMSKNIEVIQSKKDIVYFCLIGILSTIISLHIIFDISLKLNMIFRGIQYQNQMLHNYIIGIILNIINILIIFRSSIFNKNH